MMPEERLAAKLVAQWTLTPPIPIRELIATFADVEVDELPADTDAVLLRRQIKTNRPLVVLNRKKPEQRRRFTLAHELGHILIPWHIGTLSCHTAWQGEFRQKLYRATEAEANRFASEVLMPVEWMEGIVHSGNSIKEMFREVKRANVSSISAGISLCKALPPGYVFLAVDKKASRVIATAKSEGTVAPMMALQSKFDADYYRGSGASIERIPTSGAKLFWLNFNYADLPETSDDLRSAREIINGIVDEEFDASHQAKIVQRVNGIIGAANGTHKPQTPADLVSLLRQRFAGRDSDINKCVTHHDFEFFLIRRAEEIFSKQGLS